MNKEENILPDYIKDILSKYYDGLTSIEEEKLLKKYFLEHKIPESLLTDQSILYASRKEEIYLFPNNELWDKIKQNESKHNRYRKTVRLISSLAASLLIMISLGIGFYLSFEKKSIIVADTFSNPEDAYKAVQKYLGFTSTKLSYAYTEIKPIEKLSIPCDAIQPFSDIDKNLQRLNHLNRLKSTSQKLERFSIITDFIKVDENN